MKTYTKRIAFLISSQHLIPHGGLGSFAKSFTEMASRLNWKVDLVLDKKPTHNFSEFVEELGAILVYTEQVITYEHHQGTYSFSDCINFEQIVNFRRSLVKAFNHNIYDMIVCNTQESMSSAYSLDLSKYIPIVFYTHQASMVTRENDSKDVFLQPYHDFYNKHLEFPGITVGTQSARNMRNLLRYGATNVSVLPMPLSERSLLEESKLDRSGVLYIGRWEPRKNPEAFVKMIQETKLPARVMTNKTGAKKFKAEFDKLDITDYQIKSEIYGDEKSDFIKSCVVHYNPSYSENYPFVFYECLGQLHCVVLDTQDWADNFDEQFYHVCQKKEVNSKILELYNTPIKQDRLDYVRSLDSRCEDLWSKFVTSWVSKTSTSNVAKINNEHTTTYSDFIISLNRSYLSQEDIVSVLGNKHKFKVIYTDNDTWLSKDTSFEPTVEVSGLGLFEGL